MNLQTGTHLSRASASSLQHGHHPALLLTCERLRLLLQLQTLPWRLGSWPVHMMMPELKAGTCNLTGWRCYLQTLHLLPPFEDTLQRLHSLLQKHSDRRSACHTSNSATPALSGPLCCGLLHLLSIPPQRLCSLLFLRSLQAGTCGLTCSTSHLGMASPAAHPAARGPCTQRPPPALH